jgi:hypothetical protein
VRTYTHCDDLGNCTSGSYHESLDKWVLVDPKTGREIEGWQVYPGAGLIASLAKAVGCP